MAEVKVVNKRNLGRPVAGEPGIVRRAIHRGTPLGNPFVMRDYSQKERDRVCEAYEGWLPGLLEKQISDGKGAQLEYFQELSRIANSPECKTLELICFCAPKKCHGDTVRRLLLNPNTQITTGLPKK